MYSSLNILTMVRTYSDGKRIYSVDMMLAYINTFKPDYVDVPISNYLHVLDYDGWGDPSKNIFYSANAVLANPNKYKNEYKLIKSANMSYPIIVIS